MKQDIEKAIKETLVIKNPESIWRSVDKIISIVERKQALSMSSVGGCQCKDGKWHDKKVGGWICSMCGVPV